MKRVIALLLAMILFTGILPIDAAATEQEFVNVQLKLDGKPRQYKVIESGSELMFSGEDLAAMGGYEYRIEQGSAYFTRGMKTLRVDLEASRLYPFEDIALISKIIMAEKVREVDSVYYFPGTEMLPWLNVDCFVLEGQLNICKDEVSIWEIIPVFAPEEFEFDFTACCKELGVNGKYLKARAYLQDEGLTGMFFDIIPVVGDSLDYYDLFEDIVQDQSAADEEIDEMLEDAEDVSYWMEIAEDFEVIEDLPDELRLFGEVANFLSNNAVSFSFEMASYVKNFYQNHENILAAFHSMIVNSGVYKHQLPMTAISALMEVEESYTDYYAGIEYKMMKTIGETAFEGLASVPSGLFDAATTLVGFAEATSPDWAEGINRISSYDMIAEYCGKTYGELTDHTWMSSIKDMCGLAYMYLYSCEQNWNAMADYAIKEGKLDLAAKYRAVAESTEEWQRKFMRAVPAAMNDSHEYEVVDGSMKQGYADKLKAMFSIILCESISYTDPVFQEEQDYETVAPTEEVVQETENPYAYPPEGEYTEIVQRDDRYLLCKKVASGFTESGEYYGIYDSVTGTWPLAYDEYDTYDMNYLEFYSHGNGVFSYKYSSYYGSMMFLSAELGGSFKTDKVYNYQNVRFVDGKALMTFYIGRQGYVDGRIASDTKLAWVNTKGQITDVSVPGFSEGDMFYWSESFLTGWKDTDRIFGQSFYNYNTGERLHYVYIYFYEDGTTTIIDDQKYTTRLREYIGDSPGNSDITIEGDLIRITNLEGDDGELYYAEFDRAGNVVTEATLMD